MELGILPSICMNLIIELVDIAKLPAGLEKSVSSGAFEALTLNK